MNYIAMPVVAVIAFVLFVSSGSLYASQDLSAEEELALRMAKLRALRQYDELEDELLSALKSRTRNGSIVGQLYSSIDLSEFYLESLIDYDKALYHLGEARRLNTTISSAQLHEDDVHGDYTFYKPIGVHAVPRKYNFRKYNQLIDDYYARVERLLGSAEDTAASDPRIRIKQGNAYPFILDVEQDYFPSSEFNRLGELLEQESFSVFKKKHKLNRDPWSKECFARFNVIRGMARLFDYQSLKLEQAEFLLDYASRFNECDPGQFAIHWAAHMNYLNAIWNARVGNHNAAIEHYVLLLEIVEQEFSKIEQLKRDLSDARSQASTKAFTGFLVLGLAIAAGIDPASLDARSYVSSVEHMRLAGNLGREARMYDESEFSKKLNIFFTMGEQLQLLRAVGNSYHHLNDKENCLPMHKEAAQIYGSIRSTIPGEAARISFAAYRSQIFGYLIDDLVAKGKFASAFNYAEQNRARAFIDVVSGRQSVEYGQESLNAYATDLLKLMIAREQTGEQVAISEKQAVHINSQAEGFRARGLENESQSIRSVGNERSEIARISSLLRSETVSVEHVQSLLPPDSTLVEFYTTASSIYVWIVEDDQWNFRIIDAHPREVRSHIRRLNSSIAIREGRGGLLDSPSSLYLYNNLIAPLVDTIMTNRLYVVSHAFLHNLPFEVLSNGSEYMVEKYQIAQLPSASLIPHMNFQGTPVDSLVAFGNPVADSLLGLTQLDGAEIEIEKLSEFFDAASTYLGREATETRFLQEAGNYDVMHIAAHGDFQRANALESSLYFSPDDMADGRLTAKEVYKLHSTANLVVLSACETARSEIQQGDELVGLIRGFFFTGTSSVVASRWKVDDTATMKLMVSFYEQMKVQGLPPIEALQLAKIALIKSGQYESPYYWAPFSLYGAGL